MNRKEFYNYILENFEISAETARLISNILWYVETHFPDVNEQYLALCDLLDGTIGLTDAELRKVCM